ncbi:MAG: DUF465 domain-containing protein [Pseudomonadota bacterium]
MAMMGHLEALKKKHEDLEEEIFEENKQPFPDELLIHDLKIKKLQIKDELFELRNQNSEVKN